MPTRWWERLALHAGNAVDIATNRGSQRRRAVRRYAFDAVGLVSPLTAVADDSTDLVFLLPTKDRSLARSTFSNGIYEVEVMRKAVQLAAKFGPHSLEGRTFVDVGANIGTTTLPALKIFGANDAICIEPDSLNFKILQCNLILNDAAHRVRTLQNAISNIPGTVEFELSATNYGDHRVRVSADSGDYDEHERTTAAVEAITLDDALGTLSDVPGLVWVDTQGFEGHVLASAGRLLAMRAPWVVECWPYGLKRSGGLELFRDAIAANFTSIVDVRSGDAADLRPATDIASLLLEYGGHSYTDLVLLP